MEKDDTNKTSSQSKSNETTKSSNSYPLKQINFQETKTKKGKKGTTLDDVCVWEGIDGFFDNYWS